MTANREALIAFALLCAGIVGLTWQPRAIETTPQPVAGVSDSPPVTHPAPVLWHRSLTAARAAAEPKQEIVIYFAAGSSEAHGSDEPPTLPDDTVGVLLFAADPWSVDGSTVAETWRLTDLPAVAISRDGGLVHPPTKVVGTLSETLELLR